MMECIRVTDSTKSWFLPLLPAEFQSPQENLGVYLIGAVMDGVACGAMAVQLRDDLADIRWFYVAEEYRERGVASGMLDCLCRLMWEDAIPVTCTFAAADQEDPLYLFFAEKENFSVEPQEGYVCRIPLAELAEDSSITELGGRGATPQEFFALSALERKRFYQKLQELDVHYLEDVSEEELFPSLCLYTKEGGNLKTAAFIVREGEELELVCLYSVPGAQRDLMNVLAELCRRLPKTGNLWISAVNPSSAALTDRLLPQRVITARYYRAAWDMEL
ncbi:MAG: hypothetical protein LUE24_01300 [Lachnospiraceae bacterium]|nr:hypothetical protein [Lachnospiraceae bacterium]